MTNTDTTIDAAVEQIAAEQAERDRVAAEQQAAIEAELQAEQNYQIRRNETSVNASEKFAADAGLVAVAATVKTRAALEAALDDPNVGIESLFAPWLAHRTALGLAAVANEYNHPERRQQRLSGEWTMTFADVVESAIARRVDTAISAAQSSLSVDAFAAGKRAGDKVKR